jgi:hypothetical protein
MVSARLPLHVVSVISLMAITSCSRACSKSVPEPVPEQEAAADAAPNDATDASPNGDSGVDWGGGPTLFKLGELPADAPWEGTLSLQVSLNTETDVTENAEDAPPATYYFALRGKKARWDLFSRSGKGGPAGYRIYDGSQRKVFTVMTGRQTVYVTAEDALAGDAGAPKAWAFTPFKLEPKSAMKGIACDRADTKNAEREYSVCLASVLPPVPLHLLGGSMAEALPFGGDLEARGLFPLYVMVRSRTLPDGSIVRPMLARLSVLEATRGKLPDDAFELPSYPVEETTRLLTPGFAR